MPMKKNQANEDDVTAKLFAAKVTIWLEVSHLEKTRRADSRRLSRRL